MPSPYAVLGVEPGADDGAVERAYRRRLKETHPDHGGDPEAFRAVRAAYAALRDGEGQPGRSRPGSSTGAASGRPVATVAYLNYDVLDDYGWSLDDPDLFEKAAAAELDTADQGTFEVPPETSLLEAAERCGFEWPFACRGGACANCAVAVTTGELDMPVNHILPPDQLDRRIRLSCVGAPATDELEVVYNVKHLPGLDELRLPAYRFERSRGSD